MTVNPPGTYLLIIYASCLEDESNHYLVSSREARILYLRHASFNHLESHACPSQSSSFLRLLVNELWELLLTLGCLALRRG